MNPIKISRKVNKKQLAKFLLFIYMVSAAGYGTVSGYNNGVAFGQRQWRAFLAKSAEDLNLVKTEVQTQYVVDPEKAAEAVANAAQEGAKKGADESIKANLGK